MSTDLIPGTSGFLIEPRARQFLAGEPPFDTEMHLFTAHRHQNALSPETSVHFQLPPRIWGDTVQYQITTRCRIFTPQQTGSLHLGPWSMSSRKVSTISCKLEGRPSWHLFFIPVLLSCNLQFQQPFEQAMPSFVTAVCWSLTRCRDRERSYGQKAKKRRFIQEMRGSKRHGRREKEGGTKKERESHFLPCQSFCHSNSHRLVNCTLRTAPFSLNIKKRHAVDLNACTGCFPSLEEQYTTERLAARKQHGHSSVGQIKTTLSDSLPYYLPFKSYSSTTTAQNIFREQVNFPTERGENT